MWKLETKKIQERIKAILNNRKWKMNQLVNKYFNEIEAETHMSQYYRYIQNLPKNMSVETLHTLCQLVDCWPSNLLYGDGQDNLYAIQALKEILNLLLEYGIISEFNLTTVDSGQIPNTINSKEIGERLKELREKEGLSQEKLGEKVGCTRQTIGKLENEGSLGLEKLVAYQNIFDKSAEWILYGKTITKHPKEISSLLKKIGIILAPYVK